MSTTAREFELQQCLGRGSFGEVYAATMRSASGLESLVALKLLRADIDLQNQAVRRLADEGRLLARLNHPAILRVFDLIRLDGRLTLITELIEGEDLSTLIQGESPLPMRPLLQSTSQVAGALAAALETHGPDGPLRLVHRDVKPSNIRIDRHGQAKLLDFGVARFDASDREVRTASDLVVGSIPYMAPERFVQREVDPSSDVFSLGCTLFEGLVRQRFYAKHRIASITTMALKRDRYLTHLREQLDHPTLTPDGRALLFRMLDPDPQARPTAAALSRDLEELADRIEGPTLRMWCRDRDWTETHVRKGSLDGRVLVEGQLIEPEPPPPDAAPKRGGPVIQRRAQATMEPGTIGMEPEAFEIPLSKRETLVPGAESVEAGAQTLELPKVPEREIATVLRTPPDEGPAGTSTNADGMGQTLPEPASEDNFWVLALAFLGLCVGLAVAIFFGFVVFTALMTW